MNASKNRSKGYCAREFKVFLRANDPNDDWGGLKRVVLPESGKSIWLCTACFLSTVSHLDTAKEVVVEKEEFVGAANTEEAHALEVKKALGLA